MQNFTFTRDVLNIAYNDFFKQSEKKITLKKINIKKYSIDTITAFTFILKILDEENEINFKVDFLNEFKDVINNILQNSAYETRELVKYIIGNLAHEEIKSVYNNHFMNNIISFLIFDYVIEDKMAYVKSKFIKKLKREIEEFFDEELIVYLTKENVSQNEKDIIDNSYEMASTLWELIKSMSNTKMLLLRDKTKLLRDKIINYLKNKEAISIKNIARELNCKETEILLAIAYEVSIEDRIEVYINETNIQERLYKYKNF